MNLAKPTTPIDSEPPKSAMNTKVRRAAFGHQAVSLADIYNDENNIVVWRRKPSEELNNAVSKFLSVKPNFQTSLTVSPKTALSSINDTFNSDAFCDLSVDISVLVDMFCCLFDLKRAGLRLTALNRAMCPRFHVDKVPCRLITTYRGIATEWLPHEAVDRTKLGKGSHGLSDDQSGLIKNQNDIQRLNCGDIALLKGECWEGNEGAGLVHRSPALPSGENRLLLTLDFSG